MRCIFLPCLGLLSGLRNVESTVLYCTVLYCTVLYCTELYCTVLYSIVLRCTALYCAGLLAGLRDVERYINTVMAPALPRHLGPVSLVTLAPAQLEAVR